MPSTSMAHRSRRELIEFFAWTLGLTLLVCWGPLAVLQIPGASAGGQASAGPGLFLFLIGGFVPSIVGIVLTAVREGRAGLGRLFRRAVQFRFSIRWYAAILLICLGVGGARLLVEWMMGGELRPAEPLAAMLADPVLWIAFTIQILFLGPLSEEFGWRGYAQDRLPAGLGGTLLLAAVWAVWHLPLFYIPGTAQSASAQPFLAFLAFSVGVVCLTIIMTWLHHGTGRSLGAIVLLHAATNFVGTVVGFLVMPSLVDGVVQALGNIIAALLVVLVAGKNLGGSLETAKSSSAA